MRQAKPDDVFTFVTLAEITGMTVAVLRTTSTFAQLDVRLGDESVVVDLVSDPTPAAEAAQPFTVGPVLCRRPAGVKHPVSPCIAIVGYKPWSNRRRYREGLIGTEEPSSCAGIMNVSNRKFPQRARLRVHRAGSTLADVVLSSCVHSRRLLVMTPKLVFAIQAQKLPADQHQPWQSIGDAMEAAASADASNVQELLDLAVSHCNLGEVAANAGKLDDAHGWLEKAVAVREALVAADPSNAGWQRDLAVLYERLGSVAVRVGRPDHARGWLEKSLAVREAVAAASPNNAGCQSGLPVSYFAMGDLAMSLGKLDDARGWFEKALAIVNALAEADPSNVGWQSNLSVSYNRLGELALRTGKFDDTRGWFEKALAVADALTAADPSNASGHRELSVAYRGLGQVALRADKIDDARSWFEKALAVRKALAAADPGNTDRRRDLFVSYIQLGEVSLRAGKLDDARGWFEGARALASVLVAADPGNAGWQRDLTASHQRLGDVAGTAGKLDDARGWFEKDLVVCEALTAADPGNAGSQRDLQVAYSRLGDVALRASKLDDARGWFGKAREVTNALAADPSNPESALPDTTLSDFISVVIANPSSSQAFAAFHEALMESMLGVIVVRGPMGWPGEFRSTADNPLGLGTLLTPDGRSMISACADRAAFVRKFDPIYNAEMHGRELLSMVLESPNCDGVWVNSAVSLHSATITREDIARLLGSEIRTPAKRGDDRCEKERRADRSADVENPRSNRPWWKFW
jgi:tetratricopeptide (TPR) repeat protein